MSEHTPGHFDGYGKRCLLVFGVVVCITAMMVGVFYSPLWNAASPQANPPLAIALTLVAAVINAALVAGYLMHLLSERKLIFIVLLFTAIFVAGLFVLSIGARFSVPAGTIH